jgi:hypothetical protein
VVFSVDSTAAAWPCPAAAEASAAAGLAGIEVAFAPGHQETRGPMKTDIVALLEAEHEQLSRLRRQLRLCPRIEAAEPLFKRFATTLGGHLTAVRKVVYPGLKSVGWKDVRSDLLLAHARLSHSFAELLTLKTSTGAFAEALADVMEATRGLVELERAELLPWLRAHLDAAQRMSLGLAAEGYLVHAGHAAGHEPRQHASEWLEEARLLLSGVHAPPAAAAGP